MHYFIFVSTLKKKIDSHTLFAHRVSSRYDMWQACLPNVYWVNALLALSGNIVGIKMDCW